MDRWQSWSIAPDLKSGGPKGSVGSNPTLSAIFLFSNVDVHENWIVTKPLIRLANAHPSGGVPASCTIAG